jgi:hypothetical protein
MTSMTWTSAPADLLGLGGSELHQCTERDSRLRIGISPAPRVAPLQGSGVPAVTVVGGPAPFAHNSIGTTLGIHPSGRPLS